MESIYRNPIAQRVQNGTIDSRMNLCASCRFNTERTSSISGKTVNLCEANYSRPFLLTERIGRCNRYLDRNRLTLQEMNEIGWVLEQKKNHGFNWLTPEERQRRQAGAPPAAPQVGF